MIIAIISLGGLGLLFGGLLAFAARKFAVEVDPRVEMIQKSLPGANCGVCGYAGCSQYAEAVVAGRAPLNACPPGGSEVSKKIAGLLGMEAPADEARLVAQMFCLGDRKTAKDRAVYDGYRDCRAALMFGGGVKACSFGCVGEGNCVRSCPVEAITMNANGLPLINYDLCISCGKCKDACPRQIIEMVSAKTLYHVRCKSQDKGKQVREVCSRGCIACGLCVKKCPVTAIRLEQNLAIINCSICNNCGACVEVCPQKTIA